MNSKLLSKKMDEFFARVTGEELVSQLEDLGYDFSKVSEWTSKEVCTVDVVEHNVKFGDNLYQAGESLFALAA
ncbi:MAG: hypothetical protein K9J17_13510 [Flavobacteriales bacterium]|nr:hypothetical protein [Flavobacteriales bacterium]